MTLSFQPCSSCNRHIRSDEGSCPFCGTDVSEALSAAASAPRARGHFGRAALLAASTLAVAPAACSGTTTPGSGGQGTGGAAAGTGGTGADTGGTGGDMNTQPVYGAPFTGGSDQGGASGAAGFGGELQDDEQVGPVYGAPPPVD